MSKIKYEDGIYKPFTDERTGRSYYYITITGKDTSGNANSVTVMAENLNIGEMVRLSQTTRAFAPLVGAC